LSAAITPYIDHKTTSSAHRQLGRHSRSPSEPGFHSLILVVQYFVGHSSEKPLFCAAQENKKPDRRTTWTMASPSAHVVDVDLWTPTPAIEEQSGDGLNRFQILKIERALAAAEAGTVPRSMGYKWAVCLAFEEVGDAGAERVARGVLAFQRPNRVQQFRLRGNWIGVSGAVALAKCLPVCPSLLHLDLSKNELGNAGVTALVKGLPACPSLQVLWLVANGIGHAGAVGLAQGLGAFPSLRELDLSGNKLGAGQNELVVGDAGVTALAKGLPACTSLQILRLANNGIGDACVVALVQGLQAFAGLRKLDLQSNKLGTAGAEALSEGLRAWPSLQVLNVTGNRIETVGFAALLNGLRACPSMRHLWLWYDRMEVQDLLSEDDCDAFQATLEGILSDHDETRDRSRSAALCMLWCYDELRLDPRAGRGGDAEISLRSVPQALVLQIAGLVRVPNVVPPSDAVQLAQTTRAAREANVHPRGPISDGGDAEPALKRRRF
jgi:Leucine Rich repeat